MEYSASADTIFQPQDLGVELQSTHGSTNVQPAAFGAYVMFAAENGRKVRAMGFSNEEKSWLSPDVGIKNPDITAIGIRRLLRLRNPHQMLMVLLATGRVALLHHDPEHNINAWSLMDFGGFVLDLMVLPDSNGLDVPFMVVRRQVGAGFKIYIEAIPNWFDSLTAPIFYMNSHTGVGTDVEGGQSVFPGYDHLEGINVYVVADGNFLGSFLVENGEVTLKDGAGTPILADTCVAGLPTKCHITTLPLAAANPGSTKRYSEVSVRTLISSRPLINGVAPPERDAGAAMNVSQYLDLFNDIAVSNLGSDKYQFVRIEEPNPVRCEIVGIYGKVTGHSV